MKIYIYTIAILILTFSNSRPVKAQLFIDVESGVVFTGYNDVQIPGDKGTLFSLADDLEAKTEIFYRLRVGYVFNSRHSISALYAPLETKSDGRVAHDILFDEVLFPANSMLNGTYKFNSYRLTYRYDIINSPKIIFGFGFTAKIRDAAISLSSSDLTAEKTNVGFVPLINFRLMWKIDDKYGLLLDGDALAAPQGRAEDILLAATCKLSDRFGIRAGYRILEGGADNDEVYNFAIFHYVSVGVSYSFEK